MQEARNVRVRCRDEYIGNKYQKKLSDLGLIKKNKDTFIGKGLNNTERKSIRKFCRRHKFTYEEPNAYTERSCDYRERFFAAAEPDYHDGSYRCVYCGKKLRPEKVTVDHLYPIGRAKKDIGLQKKLARKGIKNINDPKNLVPACLRCNQNKGDKTGFWILRGQWGKRKGYWIMIHTIRGFFIILGIVFLLWLILNNAGATGITLENTENNIRTVIEALAQFVLSKIQVHSL